MRNFLFVISILFASCNVDMEVYKHTITSKQIHRYKQGWSSYEDYYITLSNGRVIDVITYKEYMSHNIGDTVYIRCGCVYYTKLE